MFGYKQAILSLAVIAASMLYSTASAESRQLQDWDYSSYYDAEAAAGTAIGVIIFVWIMIPVCCVCCTILAIWGCCTGCGGRCGQKATTTVVVAGGAQPAMQAQPAAPM